jgi:excisionase family DNA binding protein
MAWRFLRARCATPEETEIAPVDNSQPDPIKPLAVKTRRGANSKPDPQPLAVKTRRAAKLLDVSERSIRNYVERGLLDAIDVGGLRLIRYSSIERLLGQKEVA